MFWENLLSRNRIAVFATKSLLLLFYMNYYNHPSTLSFPVPNTTNGVRNCEKNIRIDFLKNSCFPLFTGKCTNLDPDFRKSGTPTVINPFMPLVLFYTP